MANRTTMASHYKIFDYWKDKCITRNGDVKIEYGYPGCTLTDDEFKNSIPVIEDWGEPRCWCCGRAVCDFDEIDEEIFKKDESLKDKDDKYLKELWSNKRITSILQRAHIIPNALKGSGNPENLFLICPTCHLESPDVSDPKFFLRYIYDERLYGLERKSKELLDYTKKIGLYIWESDESAKLLDFVGTHSATITASSIMSYAVIKLINGYNNLCNMTVREVKNKNNILEWVDDINDTKRAEPYINIYNKMLQLSLNPNPNDVSILEFRDIISHSNNYEIATLISNKYKCNCF